MINTGLFIDTERGNAWLDAFQKQRLLTGISCKPELFVQKSFAERIAALNIQCVLLQEITSEDTEALFELADTANGRKALHAGVYKTMHNTFKYASTANFTVPFRLDGIPENEWNERSAKIIDILVTMLSAPMPHDFSLQLPVQLPRPFPNSTEQERALELLGKTSAVQKERWDESFGISEMPPLLSKSSLSLCVHVHPDDNSMLDAFASSFPMESVGSLIFHYDIAAGETLFDDEQQQWADFLKSKSFNGNVIFNPVSCPDARIPEICDDASAWAVMYS